MADIELYRPATEAEITPVIIKLGGDPTTMNLVEMNAFLYTEVKENPRLDAIADDIIDETKLLYVVQVYELDRYFSTYDIYKPNKQIDDVNAARMTEIYDYLKIQVDTLNTYLSGAGVYPAMWTLDNQDFVTSHPAGHFKYHTWDEVYDNSTATAFNYPDASDGWEGIGLGFNETPDSDLQVDFFDKQESNFDGEGFQSGFWDGKNEIFTTPWPDTTLSNQSNRSARNAYVFSRVQVSFTYPGIGTYTDYLYHIEADFRLRVGLDSSFFLAAGIDVSQVISVMDEWDVINNNRENSYTGTRINVQRNFRTLTTLENQLRRDKILIDSGEV